MCICVSYYYKNNIYFYIVDFRIYLCLRLYSPKVSTLLQVITPPIESKRRENTTEDMYKSENQQYEILNYRVKIKVMKY